MKLYLKPKEILVIIIGSIVIPLLGWGIARGMNLPLLLVLVGLAIFVMLFVYMELTKRTHHSLRTEVRNAYAQTDALMGLYNSLPMRRGLPVLRGWVISPDFGQLILQTIEMHHPKHIVECGSGISTLICGYGLQKNAVLDRVQSPEAAEERIAAGVAIHSLDHDPAYAAKTRELLRQHSLQKLAEVVDAPLKTGSVKNWDLEWYHAETGDWPLIDLLIIDGPPKIKNQMARYPAMPFFFPKMRPGGCILVDDAHRQDVAQSVERWKTEFPQCIFEDHSTEKGACLIRIPFE